MQDEQIMFGLNIDKEDEEQTTNIKKTSPQLNTSEIEIKNKLYETVQILFDLINIPTGDLKQFKKMYSEYLYRLDEISRELIKYNKNEIMFTSHVEMFRELTLPLQQHRFFKKITNTFDELKSISSVPIFTNNTINPMLLHLSKEKESYMKLVLDETRAYEDIEKALLLYGTVRSALNRASYLESKMLRVFRRVDSLNIDRIVSTRADEMFTIGDKNYTPFYKPYEYSMDSNPHVCSLCYSVAIKDERGKLKCRGEDFCSYYRDKSKEPFIKVNIPNEDRLWVINDMYYYLVTLPNLFEQITLQMLQKKLPTDEYIIHLYPGIDREGDLKVISKKTGRVYLIDCKKYMSILTLINYELSSIATLKKVRTLPKNHEFMFVIPGEIIKHSNIEYVKNDKLLNKLNVSIFSEMEVANYILNQEKKYLKEQEV